jgi:hypothetical protein
MRKSSPSSLFALLAAACAPSPSAHDTSTTVAALETQELVEQALDSGIDDPSVAAFGFATAVFEGRALVGAPGVIDTGTLGAIPFEKVGVSWDSEQALWPSDSEAVPFTDSVAVSATFAVLGTSDLNANRGAVWVFPRESTGWGAAEELVPTAAPTGTPRFGVSLALDEDTLLVGAPFMESSSAQRTGAVFVYGLVNARWQERQILTPSGPNSVDSEFGSSVALLGDMAVVGAPLESGGGAVYVFERGASWTQVQHISSMAPDAAFGDKLALTSDWLFVGAPAEDNGMGAAHAYTRGEETWAWHGRLTATEREMGDAFGRALAVGRDVLFVGVPFGISAGNVTGRVDCFALDEELPRLDPVVPSDGTDNGNFGRSLAASSSVVLVGGRGTAHVFALDLGAACSGDYDCHSGSCSEGVCCDTPCNSPCHSCRASNKPSGAGGDGICEPVRLGTDPHDDCEQSAEPCGRTGVCGSEGQCVLELRGVMCEARMCADSAHLRAESQCNGLGDCVTGAVSACEPGYLCRNDACGSSCSRNADCDTGAGYYCYETECVTGARCSEDRTQAVDESGEITTCEEQLCFDGVCPTTCRRTADCRENLVCHPSRHQCVVPADLKVRVPALACSTHTGGHAGRWAAALHGMVFGAGCLALRRGRARRINPSRTTTRKENHP